MTSELQLVATALNLLVSGGVLLHLLRVEHRFTKLETRMEIVLQQMHLMDERA